jgi:2-hydroxycyclohexanecarboxyl-CoA dehydrogenase
MSDVDRVAIVTGAGSGIGRAIARRLSAQGTTVVVTDIDCDAAGAVAVELGPQSTAIAVDVTSREAVEAMTTATRARYGRIDVLVNNAGWDVSSPFLDLDPDVWAHIIGINLYGVLHTSRSVLPVMVEQGRGTIVNLASDTGRVGSSGEAVYSAAKGGVIAFTKSTAREMARHGINANCVCPGPTDTALFASMGGDSPKLREALIRAIPFRRLGTPEEVANLVGFLSSKDAAFITGQTVSVSGGLTMS